ncbi:hypothetical protein LINPERPRIM_LOCUS7002 [Linum perenne]
MQISTEKVSRHQNFYKQRCPKVDSLRTVSSQSSKKNVRQTG